MRHYLCPPLAETKDPLFEEILEEIITNINTAIGGGQIVFAKADSSLNLTVIQTILNEIHFFPLFEKKGTFIIVISLNLYLTNKMTEHFKLFLSLFMLY